MRSAVNSQSIVCLLISSEAQHHTHSECHEIISKNVGTYWQDIYTQYRCYGYNHITYTDHIYNTQNTKYMFIRVFKYYCVVYLSHCSIATHSSVTCNTGPGAALCNTGNNKYIIDLFILRRWSAVFLLTSHTKECHYPFKAMDTLPLAYLGIHTNH